jgi:hypothetical protein
VEIRRQVVDDILMGRRQEESDSHAVGEATDVEGDHPGERAIERRREFVGHEPLRPVRKSEREPEAVELAITQFAGVAEQQAGLAQAALRQELHRFEGVERERIDEQFIARREGIEVENGGVLVLKLKGRRAHQGGFPGSGGSCEEDDLPRFNGELQVLGDDVPVLLQPDAEVVHDAGGADGRRSGKKVVGSGDAHVSVLMTAVTRTGAVAR